MGSDITDEEKLRTAFRRFYQSGSRTAPREGGAETKGEKR
jgi:hypothetical protein